jgi:hypothetical protein
VATDASGELSYEERRLRNVITKEIENDDWPQPKRFFSEENAWMALDFIFGVAGCALVAAFFLLVLPVFLVFLIVAVFLTPFYFLCRFVGACYAASSKRDDDPRWSSR